MKYTIALLAGYCVLLNLSGCAKVTGERIEFGHTYPCHSLRNKVYYITYAEDASRIRRLIHAAETGCRNPTYIPSSCDSDCLKPNNRCCEAHAQIMRALNNYREGFLGWF